MRIKSAVAGASVCSSVTASLIISSDRVAREEDTRLSVQAVLAAGGRFLARGNPVMVLISSGSAAYFCVPHGVSASSSVNRWKI
jgi:hypothetical protein